MLLVSLSVFGLFVGATLVVLGNVRAETASALDGLTLGMLPALVLARLLPHAFEALGLGALVFAGIGYGGVVVAHRGGARVETRLGHSLVMPALWLHAVSDGAALAMSTSGHAGASGTLLAVALILHRIPEGLFVASTRAAAGPRAALLAVAPLALFSVLGAVLGENAFGIMPDGAIDAVLALGAGALLRLVAHTHEPASPQPRAATAMGGLAFIAGVALVVAIPGPDDVLRRAQPHELSIATSALPLFIASAPSVLLGLFVAGALRVLAAAVSGEAPRRSHASSAATAAVSADPIDAPSPPELLGSLRAAIRGLGWAQRWPSCSRGVLPEAQRLFASRWPAASVLAFATATPVLAIDAAFLSLRLLGTQLTVTRIAGGIALSLGVGVLAAAVVRGPRVPAADGGEVPRLVSRGWLQETTALLDHTGAWLVLGLLLAAAVEAALDPALLGRLAEPWSSLLAAALALPVYVCAQAATPLAAVLLHKGASVGAALSFLWIGPALNMPLLALLRRNVGRTATWALALGSVLATAAISVVAGQLVAIESVPEVHPLLSSTNAPWEQSLALLLGALLLSSLLRLGPRAFFAAMSPDPHAHFDHTATSPPPAAAHSHLHAH